MAKFDHLNAALVKVDWRGVKFATSFLDLPLVTQAQIVENGAQQFLTDGGNAGGAETSDEKKVLQAIARRDALESGTHTSKGSGSKLSHTLVTLRGFVARMLSDKYPTGYNKAEIAKAINANCEDAYFAGCVFESGGDMDAAKATFDSQYPALRASAEKKGAALDAIDADSDFDPSSFPVSTPTVRAA